MKWYENGEKWYIMVKMIEPGSNKVIKRRKEKEKSYDSKKK